MHSMWGGASASLSPSPASAQVFPQLKEPMVDTLKSSLGHYERLKAEEDTARDKEVREMELVCGGHLHDQHLFLSPECEVTMLGMSIMSLFCLCVSVLSLVDNRRPLLPLTASLAVQCSVYE